MHEHISFCRLKLYQGYSLILKKQKFHNKVKKKEALVIECEHTIFTITHKQSCSAGSCHLNALRWSNETPPTTGN